MKFNEVCELQVGDRIIEEVYGRAIPMRVLTPPEVTEHKVSGELRRKVEFTTISGVEEIHILLTEGLEHYGPRLHKTPQ